MPAGATLFPGDVIHLGAGSTAALRFGINLVLAAPETEVIVEAGGAKMINGFLQVRAGGSEPFDISGPFFNINVAASNGMPSSAEIRLGGGRAEISSVAGEAELTAAGGSAPIRLHSGEMATLEAGADPASSQTSINPVAGKISRLMPQVEIDRGLQHVDASASDRVFWNDTLRSGPTGRAHVTLSDGSQLNLGSDSSLRILQHDAQSQQTSLDLLAGRMRGKITKLTRPGSKFEIHTPVGVAGLVGTDMYLLVADDHTELMVFDGTVRFITLSGQPVFVNAGMMIRISTAGVVEGPFPATPQGVLTAQSLTDITGAAGKVAAGASSSQLVPIVVTVTANATIAALTVWQATRPTVSAYIPK
jgi:ferric-dicitrate binding protein FerR (iron transport regulator)